VILLLLLIIIIIILLLLLLPDLPLTPLLLRPLRLLLLS